MTTGPTPRYHLLWRIPVLCALGLTVLLSGLASLSLPDDPLQASTLYPLRTDARIDKAIADLNGISAITDPAARSAQIARTEAYARRTLKLAPGDARAYSVVGAVEGLKGETARADQYYDAALSHAKTEIFALTNRMSHEYGAGNYAAALDDADVIMRRWFRYRDNLVPALIEMTASPGFGEALADRLRADPPWRRWLVSTMALNAGGLPFLESLMLGGNGAGQAPPAEQIAWVVNGFLTAKEYARAYRLFILTLDESARKVSGLVHDGGFERGFGLTGFEWRLRKISTAEASIRSGPEDDGQSGLRIRFLDSPTQLRNVSQMLVLPAGPYTISADVTAQRLVLPRGMFWNVQCAETYALLGRLKIDDGVYRHAKPSATFQIPPDCPAQILELVTDQMAESFRQQYKGQVVFGHIAIVPATTE